MPLLPWGAGGFGISEGVQVSFVFIGDMTPQVVGNGYQLLLPSSE
jgi:hypothetical protein